MGVCGEEQKERKQLQKSLKSSTDLPPASINEVSKDDSSNLKKILKREKLINEKESELNRREKNLINRESNINTREKNINIRENEIEQRNQNLNKREYSINQKKNNQDCNKNNSNKIKNSLISKNFNNNKSNISQINSQNNNRNNKEFEFNNLKESSFDKKSSNISFDNSDMQEYKIIEGKKKEEIGKFKEFYDMVLDFSNFGQLEQGEQGGWKIKWPKMEDQNNAKEKYNRCNENKNVVVGILGNKNRGKSFLLGRIIGNINFINKSGFLITTEGISANFPLLDNTNIITLDTAGKDNPLLDSSNFIKNLDISINTKDKENAKLLDNSITAKDKKKNKNIKDIARDQRVSEIVLSDFIIKESDVLITVLEQLSFAEQDMLKNLINQLKSKKMEANSVQEKKLLVIHNLMNFTNVKTIDNFIKNTLLKSLTFDLRYGKQPLTNFKEGNIDDRNKYFYVQKTENVDKLKIFHIIVGNDLIPEVKKEYNEPAIRFIRKVIKTGTARETNLIEDFKNFIITNSQKYLSGSGFQKDSLEIVKKGDMPEAIILNKNYKKEINLKGFFVDSKGINNFLSTIEPKYSTKLYKEKNEDKYFIKVIFEIFGKIKEEIRSSINIVSNQHVITIAGKIIDDKKINKDIIQGNLKYSDFYFQIIIDKYITLDKNEKLGIYGIKYPIKFIKMS